MSRSAIIERLEKADSGSRGLDVEVHFALFPDVASRATDVSGGSWKEPSDRYPSVMRIVGPDGHYTSSLEAALSLAERVFPGRGLEIVRFPEAGWSASVLMDGRQTFSGECATPALAVCIAVLAAA